MSLLNEFHLAIMDDDCCPRCLGELDEGWECNACGFDALPLLNESLPELTEGELAAMNALPEDYIEKLIAQVDKEAKGKQ